MGGEGEEGGGEGGNGRSKKKKFAQGKIKWKKVLARQLILKNIYAMAKLKKKIIPEFDNEKKIPAIPPPPHNFSNGPSLS